MFATVHIALSKFHHAFSHHKNEKLADKQIELWYRIFQNTNCDLASFKISLKTDCTTTTFAPPERSMLNVVGLG